MDPGRDDERGQIFSGLRDGIGEGNPRPVTWPSCIWRPRMTLRLGSWMVLALLVGGPGTRAAETQCRDWGAIVASASGGDRPFVVLQRSDGGLRYVDLLAVDLRRVPTLKVGSLVAVKGLVGHRPDEVAATSLTPLRTVRGRLAAPGIGADETTMLIIGDDGRRHAVTMTAATTGRRNITPSGSLSVVGYSEGSPERLIAVHIESIQDPFAASRRPPAASDESSGERECGTTASRVVHAGFLHTGERMREPAGSGRSQAPSAPGSTAARGMSTYYAYDSGSIRALRALPTNARMTGAEFDQQDTAMLGFVRRYKLPPTLASKLFAYLLTAQADVAMLSRAAHGGYVGSIAPVTRQVLCLFFRSECGSPEQHRAADPYSEAIGRLVFGRVLERVTEENAATKPYVRRGGDLAWWAEWPTTPDAGSWRPWLIPAASQFRAPPPPVYGSAEDRQQVERVKAAIAQRTAEQQAAVLFWAGGSGTETPAGIWLRVAGDHLRATGAPLELVLTVRSTLAMTMADAFIACWDTKYTYWTKRPFMRDPAIQSSIAAPTFPSYTSGHATVSAAAATVLGHYFPDQASRWMAMAQEAKDSRLWSGIHFPVDNDRGFELGQAIAAYALQGR